MAKVILICGKLASGKSWYCRQLMEKSPALLLSVDEITQRLFPKELGSRHDEICGEVQAYLMEKAVQAVAAGADVILDWGFWSRADRQAAEDFFRARQTETQWHYIQVTEELWRQGIAQRNARVKAGASPDYYVDEGLLAKLAGRFQEPEPGEMDVIYCRES